MREITPPERILSILENTTSEMKKMLRIIEELNVTNRNLDDRLRKLEKQGKPSKKKEE